ncbi:MAG: hypothetical protein ACOCQD_00220 [archaeon]
MVYEEYSIDDFKEELQKADELIEEYEKNRKLYENLTDTQRDYINKLKKINVILMILLGILLINQWIMILG